MAGSIEYMASVYKKTYKYVPSTPAAELIESTNYTLNFSGRKYKHVGIDPTDEFNVAVHIITPSRYVNITQFFLRQIFSLMGNILSFVLEQPEKYKRIQFLETDYFKLSSMTYNGENVLVIESKNQDGCRVLLNREELLNLQNLEWSIFESVIRKDLKTRHQVIKQVEEYVAFLDEK